MPEEVDAPLRQLEAIVREALEAPRLRLQRGLLTEDVPGWDSMRSVEIVLALEAALGCEFHVSELGRLAGVDDFTRLIERHDAPSAAPQVRGS